MQNDWRRWKFAGCPVGFAMISSYIAVPWNISHRSPSPFQISTVPLRCSSFWTLEGREAGIQANKHGHAHSLALFCSICFLVWFPSEPGMSDSTLDRVCRQRWRREKERHILEPKWGQVKKSGLMFLILKSCQVCGSSMSLGHSTLLLKLQHEISSTFRKRTVLFERNEVSFFLSIFYLAALIWTRAAGKLIRNIPC